MAEIKDRKLENVSGGNAVMTGITGQPGVTNLRANLACRYYSKLPGMAGECCESCAYYFPDTIDTELGRCVVDPK